MELETSLAKRGKKEKPKRARPLRNVLKYSEMMESLVVTAVFTLRNIKSLRTGKQ